jgi:hypothetical protein
MTTPDNPFDPRDHAACDPDRRRFLGLSFAAAAALAGLPGFAQDDDMPWLDHGDSRVKATAEQYRRQPSYDTFLTWTDELIKYGDYPQARQNLKWIDGYREKWGNYERRILDLRRLVTFKDLEMTLVVPGDLHTPPGYTTFQRRLDRAGCRPYFPLACPQNITDVVPNFSVTVENSPEQKARPDAMGNHIVFAMPVAGQDMTIKARWRSRPTRYRLALDRYEDGPLPESVRKYLGVSRGRSLDDQLPVIDPEGPLAQKWASEAKTGSGVETLRNLFAVYNQVTPYNGARPAPGEVSYSEEIIKYGGGSCEQDTMAYCAIARAAGIPARMVRGLALRMSRLDEPNQHTVPEFYLRGLGWIIPDWAEPLWVARWNYAPRYRYQSMGSRDRYAGTFLDGIDGSTIWTETHGEWLDDGESVFFDLSKSSKNEGL